MKSTHLLLSAFTFAQLFHGFCQDSILDPSKGSPNLQMTIEKARLSSLQRISRFVPVHLKCRQCFNSVRNSQKGIVELLWVAPLFWGDGETPYGSDSMSVFWSSNLISTVVCGMSKCRISTYEVSPEGIELKKSIDEAILGYEYAYALAGPPASMFGVFVGGRTDPLVFEVFSASSRMPGPRVICGTEKSVRAFSVMEKAHDYLYSLYRYRVPIQVITFDIETRDDGQQSSCGAQVCKNVNDICASRSDFDKSESLESPNTNQCSAVIDASQTKR